MLGEVKFNLCTAYHTEILFGNITGCQSAVDTHQIALANSGRETYAVQVDTAVDTPQKGYGVVHLSARLPAKHMYLLKELFL